MWVQHDGAPVHFSRAVMEFLNEGYEGKWTGKSGTHGLAKEKGFNPSERFHV
jgi:hypothetical protein